MQFFTAPTSAAVRQSASAPAKSILHLCLNMQTHEAKAGFRLGNQWTDAAAEKIADLSETLRGKGIVTGWVYDPHITQENGADLYKVEPALFKGDIMLASGMSVFDDAAAVKLLKDNFNRIILSGVKHVTHTAHQALRHGFHVCVMNDCIVRRDTKAEFLPDIHVAPSKDVLQAFAQHTERHFQAA